MSLLSRLPPDVRRELVARYIQDAAEQDAESAVRARFGGLRFGEPAAPYLSDPTQVDRRLQLEKTLQLLRDPYHEERVKAQAMVDLVRRKVAENPSSAPVFAPLLRKYEAALASIPPY